MPKSTDLPLSTRSRALALSIGTAYLALLARFFGEIAGVSFTAAAAFVLPSAIAIMVCLAAFCVKFVLHEGERRVRLGTLLLLFVPLAIYLTAIHWIVNSMGASGPNGIEWIPFASFLVFAVTITTVILLWYAEAIVWITLFLMRPSRCERMEKEANKLLDDVARTRGHFRYESGHHGDLWLDLERLCFRPNDMQPLGAELARRLAAFQVDAVCGSLVEGAFVALLVAAELDVDFLYTERRESPDDHRLFPVAYQLPAALRERARGRRVAIVADVINAGSAVRGTAADLKKCGAELAGVACLATLGGSAAQFAAEQRVPLITLASIESSVWEPTDCPLCRAGVPLDA